VSINNFSFATEDDELRDADLPDDVTLLPEDLLETDEMDVLDEDERLDELEDWALAPAPPTAKAAMVVTQKIRGNSVRNRRMGVGGKDAVDDAKAGST